MEKNLCMCTQAYVKDKKEECDTKMFKTKNSRVNKNCGNQLTAVL